MDSMGDQFLAGATLALNQNGRCVGGGNMDLSMEFLDDFRCSNDVVEIGNVLPDFVVFPIFEPDKAELPIVPTTVRNSISFSVKERSCAPHNT